MQDLGGTQKTIDEAVRLVETLLPQVNAARRETIPASEIVLGLNCGGSDGNSGITANAALGVASDRIVACGGTTILGETTEIYGAEQLLTRRARTPAVADKLIERIRWWEWYAGMFGCTPDNNPSPGNKVGGLTTIYEKSLGAIVKGGTTALNDVVQYAEQVRSRGLVVMDTPGLDPVSVTGIVAGGANVVAFTTGRGSCFRVQADAGPQDRQQYGDVRADARRHGHRRGDDSEPGAERRGCRRRDLRADSRHRQRRTVQERANGAGRRGIPAVDSGTGAVNLCSDGTFLANYRLCIADERRSFLQN